MGLTQEVVEVLYSLKDMTQGAFRQIHDSLDAGAKKADALKDKLENVGRVGQVLAVGAGAIAAAFGFMAVQSLKLAGEVEQQRVAFKGLLGSYEEADAVIARIRKVSAETPFETAPLTAMTEQLSVITRDGGKAVDILTNIGDAIAMSGKDVSEMERVVLNIQQVAATGRVTELDIRQFQSAIPMFNDILAASGLTTEQLKQSKDAANLLFGAFQKAASAGGITFGGLAMQSKTLNGTLSTLHDNFANVARQLGDGLLPIVQPVVNFFNNLLGRIGELSPKTKTFMAVMVITVGVLASFGTAAGVILAMLPAIAAGLTIVGVAANGALLFIPAAIAAIVAGITLLVLNFDKMKNGFQNAIDYVHIGFNNFLILMGTGIKKLVDLLNKIPHVHIEFNADLEQLKKDNDDILKEIDKRNKAIEVKEKQHAQNKKQIQKMDTTDYKDELKKKMEAHDLYVSTLQGTEEEKQKLELADLKKILDATGKNVEGRTAVEIQYNKLVNDIRKRELDKYLSFFEDSQNYQQNIILIGANAYINTEKKKYTASIKMWMAEQTAIAAGEIASIVGIPMGLLRLVGVGAAGVGVAAIEAIKLAKGGRMVVNSPTMIGPNVMAGEAGPETITVEPLNAKKPQQQTQSMGREVLILADDGSVLAKALYHRQTAMIRTGEISPRRNG